jgi:hypothetical protein
MGLVEFEKVGGAEIACKVQEDRIKFTKNWPAEAIKAMRSVGLEGNDKDWAILYKILVWMYKEMEEGTILVQIANDKNFAIEGMRIEADRGHFRELINNLSLRKGLFMQIGRFEIYRQLEELLLLLQKESKEY